MSRSLRNPPASIDLYNVSTVPPSQLLHVHLLFVCAGKRLVLGSDAKTFILFRNAGMSNSSGCHDNLCSRSSHLHIDNFISMNYAKVAQMNVDLQLLILNEVIGKRKASLESGSRYYSVAARQTHI